MGVNVFLIPNPLEIKKIFIKAPILIFPDFEKKFILDTVSSYNAIGAFLSQNHVTTYDSRERYCITRKELLTINYFCQHFNDYLYGKIFRLRTDVDKLLLQSRYKNVIPESYQSSKCKYAVKMHM